MDGYLAITVMLVLSSAFVFGAFGLTWFLSPKRPTKAKQAPYECGIVPTTEPAQRFPVRFYLIAMLFIIFDVEIVFLYPWAVASGRLGLAGLIAVAVFSIPVIVTLAYEFATGTIDWGPVKRRRSVAPEMTDPARSSRTTIRTVGRKAA